MATYTVKAPDGKTVTLQGPDGASQADIIAQAQKLYQPKAAPASSAILEKYNSVRNQLAASQPDETRRQLALTRFDSDPRMQAMRKAAGLAPVSTVQHDVKAVARKALVAPRTENLTLSDLVAGRKPLTQELIEQGQKDAESSTAGQGFAAGFDKGTFGLPQMLAAAGLRFLPSALTGNNTNLSYDQILQIARGIDNKRVDVHPYSGTTGELTGGIMSMIPAARGVGMLAEAASASRLAPIARAGNVLQELATLRKGQKLANVGKIMATGAVTVGGQAAGTGGDISAGAAEGAIAAPVAVGAAKVLGPTFMRLGQVLSAPFTDFLKMPNATRVLGKITNATADQVQAEAAKIHAANPNANPTLFELLPLGDRNRIMSEVASKNDNVAEQAGVKITNRAKELAPEMQDRVSRILQPNRHAIQMGLTVDLAGVKGGAISPEDAKLASKALDSTTDMQAFRKAEADAIMAPHRDTPVASLNDLIPSTKAPDGTRLEVDPEVSNAIRSVAGSARAVPNKVLTVDRVVDMIQKLKSPSASLDPNIAKDAESHLQGLLGNHSPDVAAAAQKMNDQWAARSRILEGMSAGGKTQLREGVDTGTSAKSARLVSNAYDTPEGDSGRALGQGNTLLSDLGGGPGPALRLTNDIAGTNNDIGRELEQNLGSDAAPIISAAQAQAQSGEALGTALNQIKGGADNGATPLQALTQVVAALHPSSFAATKAKGLKALMGMGGIPENRARTIVDMVFSQDPALQAKAVNALGNESTGKFVKYLAGIAGQLAGNTGTPPDEEPAPVVEQPPADEIGADANDPSTWEKRPDGSTKGTGFLGVMQRPDGSVSSEISVGLPINGKEMDIPTMVPGLTSGELHWLLNTPVERIAKELPDSIRQKAVEHAQQRIAAGKSPFLEPGENAVSSQSQYAPALQQIYQNENPDLIQLIQKVKHQEHGVDAHGNFLTSKKGAIGPMQVTPKTAPEAAQLAGLPWDENAYKTDPAYNELLGIAYLSQLLRKYDGDVAKALAAYNAGPDHTDKAVASHGESFLSAMPAETQDYVARVGG